MNDRGRNPFVKSFGSVRARVGRDIQHARSHSRRPPPPPQSTRCSPSQVRYRPDRSRSSRAPLILTCACARATKSSPFPNLHLGKLQPSHCFGGRTHCLVISLSPLHSSTPFRKNLPHSKSKWHSNKVAASSLNRRIWRLRNFGAAPPNLLRDSIERRSIHRAGGRAGGRQTA